MKTLLTALAIALALSATLPYTSALHILICSLCAITFGSIGYKMLEVEQRTVAYICLVLTLLFQPMLRVPFHFWQWAVVKVGIATLLLLLIYKPGLLYHFFPRTAEPMRNLRKHLML